MDFFKRKTSEIAESTISTRLNKKVIRQQQKIADYLNEKTKFLSGKTLLFILILFCLVYGSYCIYLISSAIY